MLGSDKNPIMSDEKTSSDEMAFSILAIFENWKDSVGL